VAELVSFTQFEMPESQVFPILTIAPIQTECRLQDHEFLVLD